MIGPVLRAEQRSFVNGLLRDPGRRGLLAVAGVVLLALGSTAAWRLNGLLAAWKSAGALVLRLSGVCLLTWTSAAALMTVVLREQAASERARLLFTLPLSPAERARSLVTSAAAQLANFWLLSVGSLGSALFLALGFRGLAWLGILLAGPVLVLLLALGPLADRLGRLYERAFRSLLGATPRPRRRRFARLVTRLLAARRTLSTALLVREILSRGRHWVDWARFALVAGFLAGFPHLRPALLARGLPDALTIPGGVALLAFLLLVDGSSSPLGAEGNRLALLLTAPLSRGELLRAKLAALLLPLLLGTVAATLLLGLLCRVGLRAMLGETAASALILAGLVALFTWGSAWDADPGMEIEPGLRGLLQEQTPLTPVRALLVALGGALLGLDLLLLRALPEGLALPALAMLQAAVLGAGWRMGVSGLRRLSA